MTDPLASIDDDSGEQPAVVSTGSPTLDRDSSGGKLIPEGTIYAGKYEILSSLGGGSSGQVYSARRVEDGLPCALKILHQGNVSNRQAVQRFRREATILARLDGPHIVRVHDFGEDQSGRLYLALEYAPGRSLRQFLLDDKVFTLDQIYDVMMAVAQALGEAHGQGVIHRDLKPDNIIVDLENERVDSVHVLDFGLSKMLDRHAPGSTNLTDLNMVLGTPEYMAPEQVRGEQVDERCDIYSAGVVLYQMVYGKPPFEHRIPLAIMTAHLTEAPAWRTVRSDGQTVPPALLAVMQHTLAKDPNERYPTAGMLLEALRKARSAPEDLLSVRPPPPEQNDVAFSTTLSVELGENGVDSVSPPPDSMRTRSTRPPAGGLTERGDESASGLTMRTWIVLLVLVGLAGLAAGVLLALHL